MSRKLQPILNSFIGFTSIEIYPDECLGTGAYGAVCKAMCDELPCAAKLLHSVFFQSHDPGMPAMMRRFQQECDLIGRIRHPCIVQYLGTVEDPESHRPILLMELMDESLTKFLEHSNVPLAYHLQVNLCYNIALALAYLHSNGVVHRDLSSNNVLITAGSRAKVTDFGMLKLLEQNMRMTPLTKCPGTVAYMPPEALSDDPVYTDKLDCFSLGVLMIQIITRNFPEPTKATVTVHDPKYPTGRVLVPVPEVERRKKDTNLIQVQNPLRTIALDCIKDIDTMRPSARDTSSQLSSLKRKEEYSESFLRKQDDAEHATLRPEMERVKEENVEIKRLNLEKDREIDNLKQQLRELKTVSEGSEVDDLRQQLCELKIINEEKDAEIENLRKQLHKWETKVLPLQKLSSTRWTLKWDERVPVSTRRAMWRGAATSVGPLAFFNPGLSGIVYVYDSTTKDWSELPHLVHSGFTLVTINNLVTAVGGNRELYTPGSTLLSFSKGKWVEIFPPMPTKRYFPAAVCTHDMLVVAGGCDCIALPTVEVMDINTLQWTVMASLPISISSASMAAYEDSIYLLGDDTNRVYSCSIKFLPQPLEESQPALNLQCQKSIWKRIADVPVSRSTAVTLCGQLVSVGGYDYSGEVDTVYCYDSSTNSWRRVGTLLSSKGLPLATTLPGDKLVVVHGNHENALVGTATAAEVVS